MRSRQPHPRPFRSGRAAAAGAVLALAIVGLTPTMASAAEVGGSSFDAPVPLPVPSLAGTFDGSNVGITTARTASETTPPFWTNVAWYSFTPEVSGTFTIRTASHSYGSFDTTLEVWTAAGGFVGQNDDYGGLDSRLTVDVRAGTPYRLGLGSWGSTGSNGVATMALEFVPRAPTSPLAVQADAGDRSADVSWSLPDDPSGATSYTVWCTPAGGAEVECGETVAAAGQPPATETTVTGLTNGVTYSVRVTAHNSVGGSAPSAATSVTPQATSSVTAETVPAAPVSGSPFDVVVTVSSTEGAGVGTVDVAIDGDTVTDIALVDGVAVLTGVVKPVGSYPVTATYSGSAAVLPGSDGITVDVAKRPQVVTLEPLPDDLVYGQGPVTVVASSSVGLPVTLTASGACTISGDQLTLTGAGECTVTAEAGDDQTETASASRTVGIDVRSQELDVTTLTPMVYGQDPVPFAASSSVDLPVTVTASGACELVDGMIRTTGAGECVVTATQAGDANTHPAEVVQTVDVAKRPQTVSITGVPALIADNAPLVVDASSSVGLPVTLTASGACTLDGGTLTIVDVGECRVTADAAGDAVTEPGSATVVAIVMGEPAAVQARLGLDVGDIVEGAPVQADGTWLRPGTDLTLVVYSDPTRLGTDTVAADGVASVDGVLPALSVGAHRLVAEGVGLDGATVTATVAFGVDEFGQVAWIGVPPALATTGTDLVGAGALALMWVLVGAGLVLAHRVAVRVRVRTVRA